MARPSLRPSSVRYLRRILITLSIGASLLMAGQSTWQKQLDGQQPASPPPDRLLFVPIGAFPDGRLADLVSRYQRTLGLHIEVMPPIPIDPSIVNRARRQLVAERVVLLIKETHPTVADDYRVAIIGLTTQDMYIEEYTWRFAFAYRVGDRIAVVSSARMDPTLYGEPPNAPLLEERFRKMVTKNIGHVYYHKRPSRDRRNIMYGKILGLDDLDRIREDVEVRS